MTITSFRGVTVLAGFFISLVGMFGVAYVAKAATVSLADRVVIRTANDGKTHTFLKSEAEDRGSFTSPAGFTQRNLCDTSSLLHMTVCFRPDSDNSRDEVVFEYGTFMQKPITTGAYVAEFWSGNTKLGEQAVTDHFFYQRWRWIPQGYRSQYRSVADLETAKLLPPYRKGVDPDGIDEIGTPKTECAYKNPFDAACVTKYFGGTGERDDIGPVTGVQGKYILSLDPAWWKQVLDQAEAGSGIPWYIRDEGGTPVNFFRTGTGVVDRRSLNVHGNNSGTPTHLPTVPHNFGSETGMKWAIDQAHQPALFYLPWVLTGDPYYLESMQFANSYNTLYTAWDRQSTNLADLINNEIRGIAWNLRTMFQLWKTTPENVPGWLLPRSYYERQSTENITKMNSKYVNDSEPYKRYLNAMGTGFWQNDFVAYIVGWGVYLGNSEWLPVFNWLYEHTTARVSGTSGWERLCPTNYYLPSDATSLSQYTSWAKAWQIEKSINNRSLPATGLLCEVTAYNSYLQGVLAIATHLKVPGADILHTWYHDMVRRTITTHGGGTQGAKWAVAATTQLSGNPLPPAGITPTVGGSVETTTIVNVRQTANGNVIGQQVAGSRGEITTSPVQAGGYLWAPVNFSAGVDGWVATEFLRTAVSPSTALPSSSLLPSPTASLTATPSSIISGQTATLTWSSTNADTCTGTNFNTGGKPSGATTVSLTSNATFTITCGSATAQTSVIVGSAPVTTDSVQTAFAINDRVRMTTNTNLRQAANGTILGTQTQNNQGTIIAAPVFAGGFTWIKVDFDSGLDGWVAALYTVKTGALSQSSDASTFVPASTSTPTNPTTSSDAWVKIANENQGFMISGTQVIRYGKGSTWIERRVTDTGRCTNAFFGRDPLRGTVKECQVQAAGVLSVPLPDTNAEKWTKVADENQDFIVGSAQTVRYGNGTVWTTKTVTNTGKCTNAFFGKDPLYGIFKECQVRISDVISTPTTSTIIKPVPVTDSPSPTTDVVSPSSASSSSAVSWNKIADENRPFSVSGTQVVRYGKNSSWVERTVTGSGECTNTFFGRDPLVGTVKECQVQQTGMSPASSDAAMLQSTMTLPSSPLVSHSAVRFLVTPFTVRMGIGAVGDSVSRLQALLAHLGYFKAVPTGVYGPLTASAVAAFQADNGLPAVGEVGARTLEALNVR